MANDRWPADPVTLAVDVPGPCVTHAFDGRAVETVKPAVQFPRVVLEPIVLHDAVLGLEVKLGVSVGIRLAGELAADRCPLWLSRMRLRRGGHIR